MPKYDFKCPQCLDVKEFICRMSEIDKAEVICDKCADLQGSIQKMERYWSRDGLGEAIVNKTLGSWMDKNRKDITRPPEFFQKDLEQKRKETAKQEKEYFTQKGNISQVNEKRKSLGFSPL